MTWLSRFSSLLQEVDQMLAWTSRVKPGKELFRTLGDNGELSLTPAVLDLCDLC